MPTILGQAGTPTTQNPEDVITALRQRRGNFSHHVHERIACTDPFYKHISREKMAFPSGRGDKYEREVFHITTPTEADLGDWALITKAGPGYNPSQDTFTMMLNYGTSKQTCQLYRRGWRTPSFNKLDLALTHDADMQLANVKAAMTAFTMAIWPAWARRNFRRSVMCRTLNNTYGHLAEQQGGYLAGILPDRYLTHTQLEAIIPAILATPVIEDTPAYKEMKDIPEQIVFMGYQEFAELERRYRKDTMNYGFQAPDVTVPELGLTGKKIGKYLFVLELMPTRFRQPVGDESWDDCIIPPTIKVPASGGPASGYKDAPNPDYYNPEVAKYVESKIYNSGSVVWFTPPGDVLKGMKKAQVFEFPAATYTGDFFPVNLRTPEDPEAENIFFAAKYIAGMMPANPGRSRCIISLAAHPLDEEGDVIPGNIGAAFIRTVQSASTHPNGNLLLLIAGATLPALPVGYSLWAYNTDGTRYKVDTVVASTAFTGNTEFTSGFTVELELVNTAAHALTDWAELRAEKDAPEAPPPAPPEEE